MADPIIKIKRSAVPGKIPTTITLPVGEFAINTYDGKVFIQQNQGAVGVGSTVIVVNPWSVGLGSDTYNTYFTAGSVGIGTTTPTSTLTVVGDTLITGIATITSLSMGGNTVSSLGVGIATAGGLIGVGATILDFRGAGISTITVASGIATINVAGLINTPQDEPTPAKNTTTFTAIAGQTTFIVSYTVGYIDVYLNGIRLSSNEFIGSGSSVILLEPASEGDILDVVEYTMGKGDKGDSGPLSPVVAITTNSTYYPLFVSGIGTVDPYVVTTNDYFEFNPSSGTLSINQLNASNTIGVGTTSPQYSLDVNGDINFTGTFRQNGSQFVASRWTSGTGDDIYRLNGDVGIGTTNPTSTLTVVGNVNSTDIVTASNGFVGNLTGTATTATNLSDAANITAGTINSARLSGTYNIDITGSAGSAGYATTAGIATNVKGDGSRVLYNSATDTTTTSSNLTFNGTTLSINSTPGANTSAVLLTGTPFGSNTKNGLLGVGTLGFTDNNIIANFAANVNSYAQVILQNLNSGNAASSDFIVNSDSPLGQDYYGDFGINGTAYNGGGPFGDTSGTYLYAKGGTLAVGTDDAQDFRIATGSAVATPVTRVTVTGTTGNVGIGTTNPTSKLDVSGDVKISGIVTATDFNSTSDINLKKNIKVIDDPILKVSQINGITFNWSSSNQSSAGVIAQDVEKVLPEIVKQTEDHKTVNYNGLIGLLIEVVKEQQEQINILTTRIEKLEGN